MKNTGLIMKLKMLDWLLAGFFLTFLLLPVLTTGQNPPFDQASIESEILARYRSFEGDSEDQTWEMWQDYFLRSPNIGNMHGTNLRVGWETYRDASLRYFQRPPEQRPAVRFENLRVFAIDERTAWVNGVFVRSMAAQDTRLRFYDVLIKTDGGWRVIFSYVDPGE